MNPGVLLLMHDRLLSESDYVVTMDGPQQIIGEMDDGCEVVAVEDPTSQIEYFGGRRD